MKTNKLSALVLCLGLATMLTACEQESEKDLLADAQFCLDEATNASTAQACMSKISGLQSKEAHVLRCAAGFVSAEITSPQRLSDALNALSQDNPSPELLLASLNFDNTLLATQTEESCRLSGRSSLALLGAMAKTATTLGNGILASCSGTPTIDCAAQEISAKLDDLVQDITANAGDLSQLDPDNLALLTQVGETIETVYGATCGGSNNANTDMCRDINAAVAQIGGIDNLNVLELGAKLIDIWQKK